VRLSDGRKKAFRAIRAREWRVDGDQDAAVVAHFRDFLLVLALLHLLLLLQSVEYSVSGSAVVGRRRVKQKRTLPNLIAGKSSRPPSWPGAWAKQLGPNAHISHHCIRSLPFWRLC